jgi:hypothetical protein
MLIVIVRAGRRKSPGTRGARRRLGDCGRGAREGGVDREARDKETGNSGPDLAHEYPLLE